MAFYCIIKTVFSCLILLQDMPETRQANGKWLYKRNPCRNAWQSTYVIAPKNPVRKHTNIKDEECSKLTLPRKITPIRFFYQMCELNRFQTQHVILWFFIRSNDVRLWQKISMYTAIYFSAFTCSGSWQLTWLSNNPCLQIPSSLRLPYWIPWLPLWILLNEEKQI